MSQEDAMAEYSTSPEPIADRRGIMGAGRSVAIVAAFFVLLAILLLACGFWSVNAKQASSSPQFNVKVVGGRLPGVVIESKAVGAGTMKTPVDLPTVGVR